MIDKELNALHRLYKKHEWRRVGKANWGGEGDGLVYRCHCGDFAFLWENQDGKVRMVPYRSLVTPDWVLASIHCMNNKNANELLAILWTHRRKLTKDWGSASFWEVFGVPQGSDAFMPMGKR